MCRIKKRNNYIILSVILILVVIFACSLILRNKKQSNYEKAKMFSDNKEYAEAAELYLALGRYKDSEELSKEAKENEKKKKIYDEAIKIYNEENYESAIEKLKCIPDFEDSGEKLKEATFSLAVKHFNNGNYNYAKELFASLGDYNDSQFYLSQTEVATIENAKENVYIRAKEYFEKKEYKQALELFNTIPDYDKSKEYIEKCKILIKRTDLNNVLAAGVLNSAAVTNESMVLVAGTNELGQKEVENFRDIISIDAYGRFVVGLTKDKTVVYSGKGTKEPDVENWTNIIDVACGEYFIAGLSENGNVYIADSGDGKELDVSNWENIAAIDAGWDFLVGLTKDGKLMFSGNSKSYQSQQEQFNLHKDKWKNVVNISSGGGGDHEKQRGFGHTVGLCEDGSVVAIGDNEWEQCNVSDWKDIQKVVAGEWFTLGVDTKGKVFITGDNNLRRKHTVYIDHEILDRVNENMESNSKIVDVAAGFGQSLLLKENGELVTFGFDDKEKIKQAEGWKNLKTNEVN